MSDNRAQDALARLAADQEGNLSGLLGFQLWDAEVREERFGKTIALFRCTQIVLYPDRVRLG